MHIFITRAYTIYSGITRSFSLLFHHVSRVLGYVQRARGRETLRETNRRPTAAETLCSYYRGVLTPRRHAASTVVVTCKQALVFSFAKTSDTAQRCIIMVIKKKKKKFQKRSALFAPSPLSYRCHAPVAAISRANRRR